MAEEMVTLDWSNEEELLKEEAEEEKKAEAAEKQKEEELLAEEKKDNGEAMDTSDNKEEEKKENDWEKTMLNYVLRGPVKVTNVQIRDLLSRELQPVLHKSVNTQIDFSSKRGTIHLNFLPIKERFAVDVLRKLARFQYANKEVKIQCSRSMACLLGYELRKQGVGPAPSGTLQFDKVLFLYDLPPETTEEVLRAMFDCPICIIPLDDEGNNVGAALLEFRSKKAAKACYNENGDKVEIGEVKCNLYNKYLVGGKKEDEEDEKEEREKKKKEQERRSKEGQKRNQNQPRKPGGAGKSFNRNLAVKQKFNQARQMGALSGGRTGMGGRMGMGGMNQGGVSPNLMMNQMMAMMKMNQNMGGDGMGMGMESGNMGRMGMGNRMGGQRSMSAGNYGMGYDDYGNDFGFDDYESGYGQGRNMGNMGSMGNMGGRRQPQSLMGGNRRGSFGSGPNEQKDSVVDLFESALDTVDSQMGNIGRQRDEKPMSGGQGINRNRNSSKGGQIASLMDMDFDSGMRTSASDGRKFDTPANHRLVRLAGNYNEEDLSIQADREFGAGKNYHLGTDDMRGSSDRFRQRGDGYADDYGQDTRRRGDYGQDTRRRGDYGQDMRGDYGTTGMREKYDDYGQDRRIERFGYDEDSYDLRQSRGQNSLSIDRNEPVAYPDIYRSKGSSGMSEMLGYSEMSKPKRTFTEQPMKRTYDDYLDADQQGFTNDDFLFKKPNLASMPRQGKKKNQASGGGPSGMSSPQSLMSLYTGPARKSY